MIIMSRGNSVSHSECASSAYNHALLQLSLEASDVEADSEPGQSSSAFESDMESDIGKVYTSSILSVRCWGLH